MSGNCVNSSASVTAASSAETVPERPLRIGLVAGELSGDQLGAALIEAIRAIHPQASFEGIAGPRMRAAGCQALARSERLAVMGLVEVLGRLPGLIRLRRRIARHFRENPPDVFVGIDAPDFNLSLERTLKQAGIPVVHWVSPSVWAWRNYRLKKIRHSVDLMLTLFPFERQFYAQHDVPAHCVGHPLADEIAGSPTRAQVREQLTLDAQRPCLALLPGSRATEVKRLLPVFLDTARLCRQTLPDLQLLLPVATPGLLPLCRQLLAASPGGEAGVTLLTGQAREAMLAADAVLVASGTATLECLLVQRPMVVAYRMHPLSFALARRMLRVPYVSLPNNLLGRMQVPEFLQDAATPQRLAPALLALLQQPEQAAHQTEPFAGVLRQLQQHAARQAAQQVIERGTH
ncbi:MAG TPA: lipid-A-disaccharide synthase [Gammaproteobacteria bacterium]|nr:lipid-A-disaccharide synthase [Gammaproteobacteria bacterium]